MTARAPSHRPNAAGLGEASEVGAAVTAGLRGVAAQVGAADAAAADGAGVGRPFGHPAGGSPGPVGDEGPGPGQVQIGAVLLIPEPHAGPLGAIRHALGDPRAGEIPPHITLVPPMTVPTSWLGRIQTHLRTACAARPPFDVRLRGTGTFRPVSPVVFVQVVEGIAECELLEGATRAGPLAGELRFHYHPHVTIAQAVPDAALDQAFTTMADFDARFTARSVDLFIREADGAWRPRTRIRLGV